jgi:hypothetical protein
MDQVPLASQNAIDAVGQVTRDLLDPRVVRMTDQTGEHGRATRVVATDIGRVADDVHERAVVELEAHDADVPRARGEAGELLQDAATKRLALGREPAALGPWSRACGAVSR